MAKVDGGDPGSLFGDVYDGGSPSGLPAGSGLIVLDGGEPAGLPGQTALKNILYLAARELQDISGRRWDKLDALVPYLNLGILEILTLKPNAYVTRKTISLLAGAKQTLGAADLALIDVICNYSLVTVDEVTTEVFGPAIRAIRKDAMDALFPNWLNSAQAAEAKFVVIDPRDPKTFYVYPPSVGSKYVLANVSTPPTPIETKHDDFVLDDAYQAACVDYVVYRILSEETTIPNALNKSNAFKAQFLQDLGLKTTTETQNRDEGQ